MARTGPAAIVELQTQMIDLKADVKEVKLAQDKGFSDLAKQIEGLDHKYASKLSERVVYGLIAAIVLFVLNGWLGLFKIPAINVVAPQSSQVSGTTPSANASAQSHSDTATPTDSQASSSAPASSGGLVNDVLKQVAN